jgi:hypothetical protein
MLAIIRYGAAASGAILHKLGFGSGRRFELLNGSGKGGFKILTSFVLAPSMKSCLKTELCNRS